MNSAIIRIAIASIVLGIVSVSFYAPAILFSFFRWLPRMLIVFVSLAYGILATVMGIRAGVLRPAGRAIAGPALGIVDTGISGPPLLCLLLLCIAS